MSDTTSTETKMAHPTLADVEEAERALAQQATEKRAAIQRSRETAIEAADQARREAAAIRLQELDRDVIPANVHRAAQAREALQAAIVETPVTAALLAIVESHFAGHALAQEAANLESVLDLPFRSATLDRSPDTGDLLASTIYQMGRDNTPPPVALPDAGTLPPTHEEQMFQERLKRHHDSIILGHMPLTENDIAALSREEYAVKLAEAEAEKQHRDDIANRLIPPSETDRSPGFRQVLGTY